jgi:4-hydroxy-2-oxoheptanedioate aldolase
MTTVKEKLKSGKVAVGTFGKFSSPAAVEILGYLGFDFVILDMEHATLDYQQIEHLAQAADAAGISTVVRVPGTDENPILRVLDAGCQGVQVPGVGDFNLAQEVVSAACYQPLGMRGLSYSTRAAKYSIKDKSQHVRDSFDKQLVVAQIESKQGMDNIEAIASLEGIDALFLGPADMSNSLGFPGQTNHPLVQEALRKLCITASQNGKIAGTFVTNREQAARALDMGVRYLVYDNDVTYLIKGAKMVLEEVNSLLKTTGG